MATQGLLTILYKGKPKYKVVAGCNGYNIHTLKTILTEGMLDTLTLSELYVKATKANVGCANCLVVMSADDVVTKCEEELHSLYADTFNNSTFNPRWHKGTADYVEILTIG